MGRAFVFLGPGWLLVGRCTGLCFGALDRFLEHGVDRYCTFPCRTAVVATAFIPFRSVLQRADAITGMKSDDGSPTTAGRQGSGYRIPQSLPAATANGPGVTGAATGSRPLMHHQRHTIAESDVQTVLLPARSVLATARFLSDRIWVRIPSGGPRNRGTSESGEKPQSLACK